MHRPLTIIPLGLLSLGLATLATAATTAGGPRMQIVAGAVTLLICCWAFRLTTEGTAALMFFLVLGAGRIVDVQHIFGGFATPAFWLVLSGLIIGKAIQNSGLSNRLAHHFRTQGKGTYAALLGRIIAGSILFAFLVPSGLGRIMLLLPLLMDISRNCGFSGKDNGHAGIILAGVLGTLLPAFTILPSNLPNIILAGAAKSIYNIDVGYMDYLLLHFPVLGLCKALLLWLFLRHVFPDEIRTQNTEYTATEWQFRERAALGVLAGALLCWMLDSLHGISPGWIGLGASLIFLAFPRVFGRDLLTSIKLDTLLFIACAISVGEIIQVSGLGGYATTNLLHLLPLKEGAEVLNVSTVLTLFVGTGLVTALPSLPSIFAPLGEGIARAADMPLPSMLMLLVPAFSTVLLPYQMPSLIVTVHSGEVPYRTMAKTCLGLGALTISILFPLNMLWWNLLGMSLGG